MGNLLGVCRASGLAQAAFASPLALGAPAGGPSALALAGARTHSPGMPSLRHEYPLLIIERHLDTFGHVNNATYLEIFEQARWQWITDGGFGIERMRELDQGPTVLECVVHFRRELLNRSRVTVTSEVLSYVGKIGRIQQAIRLESGDVACDADFVVGLFDTKRRKLIDPTPEWLASVGLRVEDWQAKGTPSA